MKGLTSTTYLTRGLLNKVFNKNLTDEEIEVLVFSGKVLKKYSYYIPSESLLRELKIIPNTVKIELFNELAKKSSFVVKDIMQIFNCNLDTAKIILGKYFHRKWNYYYKTDHLSELLMDGIEEVDI